MSMERNFELEQFCLELATKAHAEIDQRRKYSGEPYIMHPKAVAAIVESVGGTSIQISAAYLHDVIEDTPTTEAMVSNMIESRFGPEITASVMKMVMGLTDVSKKTDGNRPIRKGIDRAHTAEQDNDTKTVKLADIIHNWDSIVEQDPNFAVVFAGEKQLLLDEALKGGDASLYEACKKRLEDYHNGWAAFNWRLRG